jgi:hypothetical protein
MKNYYKTPDPYSNKQRNKSVYLYSERRSALPLKKKITEYNDEQDEPIMDEGEIRQPETSRERGPCVEDIGTSMSFMSARETKPEEYETPQFKKSAPRHKVVETTTTTTVEKTVHDTIGNNTPRKEDETCCAGGCMIF